MKEYVAQAEKLAKERLKEYFIEEHVKHVVRHALKLCEHYKEADKLVVEIAAWLHDVVHTSAGYKGDDHNIPAAKLAREFLTSIGLDKERTEKVAHCIEAHRTSRLPEPETIEAKIVASADNLSHFSNFDFLVRKMGIDRAYAKIMRDLNSTFMLPEALKEAENMMIDIKKKHDLGSEPSGNL